MLEHHRDQLPEGPGIDALGHHRIVGAAIDRPARQRLVVRAGEDHDRRAGNDAPHLINHRQVTASGSDKSSKTARGGWLETRASPSSQRRRVLDAQHPVSGRQQLMHDRSAFRHPFDE